QNEMLVKANADSLKFLNRSEEVNRENDKMRQENAQLTKALRMTQERLVETEQKHDALKNYPLVSASSGATLDLNGHSLVVKGLSVASGGIVGKLDLDNNDIVVDYRDKEHESMMGEKTSRGVGLSPENMKKSAAEGEVAGLTKSGSGTLTLGG